MAKEIRLADLIKEQLIIDALLNNLDRNLFYLSRRINYSEYMSRLSGKKVKEQKSTGIMGETLSVTLETDYEINWNTIIPERLYKLNPTISQGFQNPVKLKTTFSKDIIQRQILVFYEPTAAYLVFELFRSNSMWELVTRPDGVEHLKSVDGKYILATSSYQSEFDWDVQHQLMLIYKE